MIASPSVPEQMARVGPRSRSHASVCVLIHSVPPRLGKGVERVLLVQAQGVTSNAYCHPERSEGSAFLDRKCNGEPHETNKSPRGFPDFSSKRGDTRLPDN